MEIKIVSYEKRRFTVTVKDGESFLMETHISLSDALLSASILSKQLKPELIERESEE